MACTLALAAYLGVAAFAQAPAQPPPPPQGAPPPAAGQPPEPPPAETPAAAQEQAPTPSATPTTPLAVKFTTPAGVLLVTVKPDKAGDFEALLAMYAEALGKASADQPKPLRAYKAAEPSPGGTNPLYVVLIDPANGEADYSWQALLTRLYVAFPDKAQEIFEKGSSVMAAPMNKLSLTPVP